jgi:PAS domain-containing protein
MVDSEVRGSTSVEHRIRKADGEYRWHQTRARPVEGGEPGVTEWVGTSTDIHRRAGQLENRNQC